MSLFSRQSVARNGMGRGINNEGQFKEPCMKYMVDTDQYIESVTEDVVMETKVHITNTVNLKGRIVKKQFEVSEYIEISKVKNREVRPEDLED
jgi:hypothetical protein